MILSYCWPDCISVYFSGLNPRRTIAVPRSSAIRPGLSVVGGTNLTLANTTLTPPYLFKCENP